MIRRRVDPLTYRHPRTIAEIDDRPSRLLTSAFDDEAEERLLRAQLDPTRRAPLRRQAVVALALFVALALVLWLVG